MSIATKRKYVTQEVLHGLWLPEPGPPERFIVKLLETRGNNLHLVQDQNGREFLVSMPTKFRKNVYVKRGDWLMVEKIEEGVKVEAEIVSPLYTKQVQHIKDNGLWPTAFATDEGSANDNPNCNGQTLSDYVDKDLLPSSDSSDYEYSEEEA